MTLQLPTEIWWKIFEILPLHDVIRAGRVNAVFLEIARELRYRNLKFVGYDEGTEGELENIRSVLVPMLVAYSGPKYYRSLSLGHYVRSLCIHPDAWSLRVSTSTTPIQEKRRGLAKMLESIAHYVRYNRRKKSDTQIKPVDRTKKRMNEQLQLVVKTMKAFGRVEQYCLIWPEHPYFDSDMSRTWPGSTEVTASFLSLLAIPSFCGNITSLQLSIPAHTLESLALVETPSLKSLSVSLVKRPWNQSNTYLEQLAIFISGNSKTLQTLSISCHDNLLDLDFFRFFHLLCRAEFAALHSFRFLWPESLRNLAVHSRTFIHKISPRLHDLRLCYNVLYGELQPGTPSWISDIFSMQGSPSMLSSLTTLRLIGGFLSINIENLSAVLSSIAHHLAEFVLEDHVPLTLVEVKMVIEALSLSSSPLRRLSIEPKELGPNVFDLLAFNFPQLQTLRLGFEVFSSSTTLQLFLTEDDPRFMSPDMPLSLVSLFLSDSIF
ncbi:hypothetical protein D9757_005201 [Collybiopsis confluens]|uniref:F-box domain-containing protein n=1 Tax=Collybiopsis confluens TaxID=2823264 RepID=A0A8H5HWC4_9AGAR|nr:hypothetical protein D9757_005201 [Collybiopsis confluens]